MFDLELGGLTYQNGHYVVQNVPAGAPKWIGYRTIQARITVESRNESEVKIGAWALAARFRYRRT